MLNMYETKIFREEQYSCISCGDYTKEEFDALYENNRKKKIIQRWNCPYCERKLIITFEDEENITRTMNRLTTYDLKKFTKVKDIQLETIDKTEGRIAWKKIFDISKNKNGFSIRIEGFGTLKLAHSVSSPEYINIKFKEDKIS